MSSRILRRTLVLFTVGLAVMLSGLIASHGHMTAVNFVITANTMILVALVWRCRR